MIFAKPEHAEMYDPEKDKVRLFGVGRSGSTLIWNICRILEVASTVQDRQFFETELPVICTYRDWRDVALSTWRVTSKQPPNRRQFNVKFKAPQLQWAIKATRSQIVELEKMKRHYSADQILFLRYERFYHDFEYIFTELEGFLNIEIPLSKRFEILEECHILSAQDQARVLERKVDERTNAFRMVDSKTRIHGSHIYYGMPGTWKYILRHEVHQQKLNDALAEELRAWDYND